MTSPVPSPLRSLGAVLTDGQVAAPATLTKMVKDFVADFLIGAAAAVSGITIGTVAFGGISDAVAHPLIVGAALANAALSAAYRIALRWATS